MTNEQKEFKEKRIMLQDESVAGRDDDCDVKEPGRFKRGRFVPYIILRLHNLLKQSCSIAAYGDT